MVGDLIATSVSASNWRRLYNLSRRERIIMICIVNGSVAMPYTKKQKDIIRRHWADRKLKFMADGSVMAKKGPDSPFGLLYTPEQAESHLKAVDML